MLTPRNPIFDSNLKMKVNSFISYLFNVLKDILESNLTGFVKKLKEFWSTYCTRKVFL